MEDDDRREAAIASAAAAATLSLNPKSSALSQTRLSKFQELRKRRLQIKDKASKIKKKLKGRSSGQSNNSNAEDCESEIPCKTDEDTSNSISLDAHQQNVSSVTKEVATPIAPKKPQKLHWGLDTKERWERKSNM